MRKLDRARLWRNPVMFIGEIGGPAVWVDGLAFGVEPWSDWLTCSG